MRAKKVIVVEVAVPSRKAPASLTMGDTGGSGGFLGSCSAGRAGACWAPVLASSSTL